MEETDFVLDSAYRTGAGICRLSFRQAQRAADLMTKMSSHMEQLEVSKGKFFFEDLGFWWP